MRKYSQLLKKYDDLKQYAIGFPGDYSAQISADVGKVMNITVEIEVIESTIWNRQRKKGEESICIFYDTKDPRCFILLDCNPGDWIYTLIVRCPIDSNEKVSEILLNWYNFCLRELDQGKQYDRLEDDMFKDTNLLSETIKRHKLDEL